MKDEFGKYYEAKEPGRRERAYAWATAIGLQDVDGLKPSKYLIKTAKRLGEGVPTYGDTKALLGLDKKTHFMGQVGDLAIEIGYAEPRYAKRGGKYEIACKGAVVVTIVQSPVVTTAKAKK